MLKLAITSIVAASAVDAQFQAYNGMSQFGAFQGSGPCSDGSRPTCSGSSDAGSEGGSATTTPFSPPRPGSGRPERPEKGDGGRPSWAGSGAGGGKPPKGPRGLLRRLLQGRPARGGVRPGLLGGGRPEGMGGAACPDGSAPVCANGEAPRRPGREDGERPERPERPGKGGKFGGRPEFGGKGGKSSTVRDKAKKLKGGKKGKGKGGNARDALGEKVKKMKGRKKDREERGEDDEGTVGVDTPIVDGAEGR